MRTFAGGLGWLVAGSVVVLGLVSVLLKLRVEGATVLSAQSSAVEKLDQLRIALGSLADSEKNAVLAVNAQSAKRFVAEARAHQTAVDDATAELKGLLESSGTPTEKERFMSLASRLDELRSIDDEVLGLAEQQTNLRAYEIAYGPLADEANRTLAALDRIEAREQARAPLVAAADARVDLLRIEVLLPPHIAEASVTEMDALETKIRKASADLEHALNVLSASSDRDDARSGVERFFALERQIITLSRQNTNVRVIALSMDQRRVGSENSIAAVHALSDVILQTRADALPSRLRR